MNDRKKFAQQRLWTGSKPLPIAAAPEQAARPCGARARVAQLVEHATENRSVGGSTPSPGTIFPDRFRATGAAAIQTIASANSSDAAKLVSDASSTGTAARQPISSSSSSRVRIAVAVTASSSSAFDPASAAARIASGIGATLFSVTTANPEGKANPGLEKVARLLNLLGDGGVPADHRHIVPIVHGPATPLVLNAKAYAARFGGAANPDADLLAKLKAAGAPVHVCAQALAGSGIVATDVDPAVTIDDSALTTMATLQLHGYALIAN